MDYNFDLLEAQLRQIPLSTAHDLEKIVISGLEQCGLYYRIFSRNKSADSAISKIKLKNYNEDKKMQDLLGVRVALYFKDDVQICRKIISQYFDIVDITEDEETAEKFSPMRLNIVCRIPPSILQQLLEDIWNYPIDQTFELQIRTIFSEGWHEVEHDLRYKNKSDWASHVDLSRNLNGIFATLENCDWAILNILQTLSYRKYKNNEWSSMLINHLRIRIIDDNLSESIENLFNTIPELAKEFFRTDRAEFLLHMSSKQMTAYPKKIDNIIFLLNELIVHNSSISELAPDPLKRTVQHYLKTTTN